MLDFFFLVLYYAEFFFLSQNPDGEQQVLSPTLFPGFATSRCLGISLELLPVLGSHCSRPKVSEGRGQKHGKAEFFGHQKALSSNFGTTIQPLS